MMPARILGPSLPLVEKEGPKERTIRSRSRSPPPSINSLKIHSVRESWMTELEEKTNVSKSSKF